MERDDVKYTMEKVIGSGGFGTVYQGHSSDNQTVIIKKVQIKSSEEPREVTMIKKLQNVPGVIKILDHFHFGDFYYLIFENDNSIDMFDFISQHVALPEPWAKEIFCQVVTIVAQCHSQGIVHMDIKDENIIINIHTFKVKLIDFGAAEYLHSDYYTVFKGTLEYAPPEWFTQRKYKAEPLTVWTLGIFFYMMLTGLAFETNDATNIAKLAWTPKQQKELSPAVQSLIESCLDHDDETRIKFQELLQISCSI